MLFQHGRLQWARLENLVKLAQEGSGGLDLSDTVRDGARVVLMDDALRTQLLLALTEDDRLHLQVGVGVGVCVCVRVRASKGWIQLAPANQLCNVVRLLGR